MKCRYLQLIVYMTVCTYRIVCITVFIQIFKRCKFHGSPKFKFLLMLSQRAFIIMCFMFIIMFIIMLGHNYVLRLF